VRIAVTSPKAVDVLTYADNVLFTQQGPLWWYESTNPVAETGEVVNPVLTFTAPSSSVYTFQFFGYSDHGINVGDSISYTATITK
jgi:secreted PhoX family phosphatase